MCLEDLKEEEWFHLRFWRLNNKEKGMNNAFSDYKLSSKLWLVYLEVKLRQTRCGFCI